jgi:hypothetical protein
MLKFVGFQKSLALFSNDEHSVVVDTDLNLVVEAGTNKALQSRRKWDKPTYEPNAEILNLVESAFNTISPEPVLASARMYTIPAGVKAEAIKALKWRKEEKRGGTDVGLNTARRLAKGGQIGIEKVRHIAKYFPRHEVDKKGKGWEPGEDNFPSNGRIAWALWGGEAGKRWSSAIVERENKKALRSAGYTDEYMADLDSFKYAKEYDESVAPEFLARVRLDGSGIDRVYKIDITGHVYVWDDGVWDNMGHIEGDVWIYDKELDDPSDTCEKSHIQIDPDSAISICARLQNEPFSNVSVFDLDREEAMLASSAVFEEDWELVDTIVSAAEAPTAGQDGNYTPEERAQNASKQVRDASGKFAKAGKRASTVDNRVGVVTNINSANGSVVMKFDDGSSASYPASQIRMLKDEEEGVVSVAPEDGIIDMVPLDTSGILGEPRTPIDRPEAQIPGTLPALTSDDLRQVLNNWGAWVDQQRASYLPQKDYVKKDYLEYPANWNPGKPTTYPPKHPLVAEVDGTLDRDRQYYTQPVRPKNPLVSDLEEILDKKYTQASSIVSAAEVDSKPSEQKEVALTPQTSDVEPMYFAIVPQDDPTAVLKLVSIIPATSKSNEPVAYARVEKKWQKDDGVLADLKSPTPPPVVALQGEELNSVLMQVDGVQASASYNQALMVLWGPNAESIKRAESQFLADSESLLAAGGLDRNRGGAENLRRYWTRGEGALKIRWGTGGDWTRCVRYLSKYLGPRAKGYCALRHKEVTGLWTGDAKHRQIYGRRKGGFAMFSSGIISSETAILDSFSQIAMKNEAKNKFNKVLASISKEPIVASSGEGLGPKFTIPLVIPENLESGDGRKFKKGAISFRELPLPLMWQIKTSSGHDGSVVVGRIDHMERTEDGIGNAYGYFDSGSNAKEVVRLIKNNFIKGISADMDQFEATEHKNEASDSDEDSKSLGKDKIVINKARVMGITIVPKPAFQECKIYLEEDTMINQEEPMMSDGVYAEDVDPNYADSLVACGIIASSVPLTPPKAWFENPKLDKATPLTITDDGRVFGHIASWDVDHIGMSRGVKPPRSRSNYSYFHTGVLRTEEGEDVAVGNLTLAGGHASLEASASEAVKHYDDTASAFADVHAGEDTYGIWVAGSLRPSVSPEQVRAARASAPSGDWRPIRGSLELVAVCQVNVPGFPIARARVASGAVMALVAAGAQTLAKMKSDPVTELTNRLNKLETANLLAEKSDELQSIKAKFAEAKAEFSTDYEDFAFISATVRKRLAKAGQALPDGSFPIRNISDLRNAIQSYGRTTKSKRASVRRHIIKRARDLKKYDMVPQEWKSASSEGITASLEAMRTKIESLSASSPATPEGDDDPKKAVAPAEEAGDNLKKVESLANEEVDPITGLPIDPAGLQPEEERVGTDGRKDSGIYTAKTQPRDEHGKFRQVLARLKNNLGTAGLQRIVEEARSVENLHELGDYYKSAEAADRLLGIVDRLDSGALNKVSLENVRSSAAELGKVIANLPLGFNNQARKIRYSDLPPALRDLMDDMITKVEAKIGKEDADVATEALRGFKSGSDVYSQGEISSEMSKLLRLLT